MNKLYITNFIYLDESTGVLEIYSQLLDSKESPRVALTIYMTLERLKGMFCYSNLGTMYFV